MVLIDILIITYVILLGLLVRKSETIPQFSFRIILIGLLLSPIVGFAGYYYYRGLAEE